MKAAVVDINKIIKYLNPRKAADPDGILNEIIKTAENIIDSHVIKIIIKDLDKGKFSENAKTILERSL